MGKFSIYNIPLRNLTEGIHQYEYLLDDQYFKLIADADSDVKKGQVKVEVSLKCVSSTFDFSFSLNGSVIVPCDRCLDDMPIDIEAENRLIVKFGKEYSEESDEVVIIPEDEGEINIAWFLYEFITLCVPMKRVHAPGKCNKTMTSRLNKHKAVSSDDESDDETDNESDVTIDTETTDPRWDALKDLASDEE